MCFKIAIRMQIHIGTITMTRTRTRTRKITYALAHTHIYIHIYVYMCVYDKHIYVRQTIRERKKKRFRPCHSRQKADRDHYVWRPRMDGNRNPWTSSAMEISMHGSAAQ